VNRVGICRQRDKKRKSDTSVPSQEEKGTDDRQAIAMDFHQHGPMAMQESLLSVHLGSGGRRVKQKQVSGGSKCILAAVQC
jgi:hypothetical protein